MPHDSLEHSRDGSPMVLIPEGPFRMGLPDGDLLAEEHEKPEREVTLSPYWIDVFPVTNARFALFLEANGYAERRWWSDAGWEWKQQQKAERPSQWGVAGWDGKDQPVAGVSWYEADAYARWAGRRLPTDAEWEKAARGTDGRRYPWGDDWPTARLANFDNQVGRTTPVGLYVDGVSPFGCHDMAGNVNNWVSDWYLPSFGRLCKDHGWLRDPRLDDETVVRVSGMAEIGEFPALKVDRGGGFATPREHQEVVGCTRKVYWTPATREPWNGFRTAMSA